MFGLKRPKSTKHSMSWAHEANEYNERLSAKLLKHMKVEETLSPTEKLREINKRYQKLKIKI